MDNRNFEALARELGPELVDPEMPELEGEDDLQPMQIKIDSSSLLDAVAKLDFSIWRSIDETTARPTHDALQQQQEPPKNIKNEGTDRGFKPHF